MEVRFLGYFPQLDKVNLWEEDREGNWSVSVDQSQPSDAWSSEGSITVTAPAEGRQDGNYDIGEKQTQLGRSASLLISVPPLHYVKDKIV